jgi:hypothetical protein
LRCFRGRLWIPNQGEETLQSAPVDGCGAELVSGGKQSSDRRRRASFLALSCSVTLSISSVSLLTRKMSFSSCFIRCSCSIMRALTSGSRRPVQRRSTQSPAGRLFASDENEDRGQRNSPSLRESELAKKSPRQWRGRCGAKELTCERSGRTTSLDSAAEFAAEAEGGTGTQDGKRTRSLERISIIIKLTTSSNSKRIFDVDFVCGS